MTDRDELCKQYELGIKVGKQNERDSLNKKEIAARDEIRCRDAIRHALFLKDFIQVEIHRKINTVCWAVCAICLIVIAIKL